MVGAGLQGVNRTVRYKTVCVSIANAIAFWECVLDDGAPGFGRASKLVREMSSEQSTGLLPQRELRQLRELVAVGEPGVALEHFCAHLEDYDVSISVEPSDEVQALAAAMEMRVTPPVEIVGESKS
jgi:hypothetical protein